MPQRSSGDSEARLHRLFLISVRRINMWKCGEPEFRSHRRLCRVEKARPAKANVSMDAGMLEAIDEEAAAHGLTRSAFIASAALERIRGGRLIRRLLPQSRRWLSLKVRPAA